MSEDIIDRLIRESAEVWPDFDRVSSEAVLRILRAHYFIDQELSRSLAEYDLVLGEFGVLAELRLSGPPFRLTPTQLYNRLLVTSGGMTGRLDKLEKRDLICRHPDPNDRRSILVELTDSGRVLIDEVCLAYIATEEDMVKVLSPAERGELVGLLKKLLVDLEQRA